MKNLVNWFKNEESGQGMVEYALIIALVSIAAIAALLILGPKIATMFNKASDNLNQNKQSSTKLRKKASAILAGADFFINFYQGGEDTC